MGSGLSGMFGAPEPTDDYLQLTELGAFLCKYVFIMLDKDKRKRISKPEYLTLVNHFREQKTTEQELDDFLKTHAAEGQTTDYIDETLFRKLIIQLAIDFDKNVSDRMKYLMGLFDKDKDGFISESDLCGVYDSIGIQVPMEPVRCLIKKYDVDGDNKLSEKEFEQLGQSAMAKLFAKSPEDILVEEALRRGSTGISSSSREGAATTPTPVNIDDVINNNDITGNNTGVTVVDNILLGKPVEILDSCNASSKALFAEHIELAPGTGDCGDGISSVEGLLSELQLEE